MKVTLETPEEAIRLAEGAEKASSRRFSEAPLGRYHPRDTLCPRPFEKLTPKSVVRRPGQKLPSHERKSWREAPERERRVAVSRSQLLRRRPKGRDEPSVGFPELVAYLGAHRVEQRSG